MMQYEVSVKCHDLADTDFFSKSDPQLILLKHVPNTKRFAEVGRTEMIKDCLSPEFVKKFRVDSDPSGDDCMRVAVIDIDDFDNTDMLGEQEFIGRAEFCLSELVSNGWLTVSLGNNAGNVTLKAVAYDPGLDGEVKLEFVNSSVEFGEKPGFLEVHRADRQMPAAEAADSQDFTLVLRSKLEADGKFQPISASLFSLSLGDRQLPLRVSCWRRKSNGSHKLLADCTTCLAELEDAYVQEASPAVALVSVKSGESCALRIDFVDIRS